MAVKCPKCQSENPADAEFCIECGSSIEFHCPKCGTATPVRGKFCKKCGLPLGEQKAPPVDYSKPQTYTPKFLAEKILSTGKSLEGERKLVTVLFADVAGYTALSEKLDPEEVHQIMEGCFQILMDEIHRYEGTIDKFTGDGVMALFGAPLAHEDHAQRACYAALAIQKALETYGQKVEKDCKIPFRMRVGLNSGPVIVGSVGKDLKMDYTAVGDTVNLASRMQTMAEPGRILVSADVYKMARDFFNFKSRGKMSVKGKEEAVEAYELLEPTEVASRIGASVLRGLTRFVGREKEMATLREAFDKAKSGSGQVVCIVGEAGVGKSRLLLELRRTLDQQEYTYLEGQCLHYGSSMPYLPLLDILRSYLGLKEGEREFLVRKRLEEKTSAIDPKLKAILPPLQELLSLKVEDEAYLKLEPQKKREKIFEAIRDLLVVESQRKPLLLAIDDFQWTDRTSEEFLTYFIGHLPNSRILLLLLYRPEYTHQWASKSCYSQIRVDELPTKSSADLVRAMLEEGEVAPELRELILNRAAGNPLFMEEFTHTLLENGYIQKKDHQYVLSRKPSDIHVPDTIQGIIAARMDRLDENLKRIMQVASVIGRDFAYRILQTITGMQEELKGHLVNLQGLEFIYEKSLYPELEYVFKHALTQEVAYNSLLLKRRKQIHERIGKAIEELYPDRLEEFCEALAHHYSEAENWEKAFQYLRLSGDRAYRGFANCEALLHYLGAVETLKKLPQTAERRRQGLDVRLMMLSPAGLLGLPEESMAAFQEGLTLAMELGDESALNRFYGITLAQGLYSGDLAATLRLAEEVCRKAEELRNLRGLIVAAYVLCNGHVFAGEPSKIVELAPKVLKALEEEKAPEGTTVFGRGNAYIHFLALGANAMGLVGRFSEAEVLHLKNVALAQETGNALDVAMAEGYCGATSLVRGEWDQAAVHLMKAVEYAGEAQFPLAVGIYTSQLAYACSCRGEKELARAHVQQALRMQQESGLANMEHLVLWQVGGAELERGNPAGAIAHLQRALEVAQARNATGYKGGILIFLGAAIGETDIAQHQKAGEHILQGIKMLDEYGMRPLSAQGSLFLAELYARTGEKSKALNRLDQARGMFREMGMDYWLARTEKALEKLKAS
jgi:class 3 adenylate cyclase/tetratricopeptide (TPR) repeat protein